MRSDVLLVARPGRGPHIECAGAPCGPHRGWRGIGRACSSRRTAPCGRRGQCGSIRGRSFASVGRIGAPESSDVGAPTPRQDRETRFVGYSPAVPDPITPHDPATPEDRGLQQFATAFAAAAPSLLAWAHCRIRGDLQKRLEAEDLVQEVGMRACLRRGEYDPARGNFRQWLFGFANRVWLETLRELGRDPLGRRLAVAAGLRLRDHDQSPRGQRRTAARVPGSARCAR